MPGRGASLTPLRRAIALLLDDPRLARCASSVAADWQELDSTGVALLREIIEIIGAYPDISPAALCERWRDSEQEKSSGDYRIRALSTIFLRVVGRLNSLGR